MRTAASSDTDGKLGSVGRSPLTAEAALAASLVVIALAAPAAAQQQPPLAPATPDVPPDWVEIGLVTDQPGIALYGKETRKVTLDDRVADSWAFACKAPCNERVDPRLTYRVMGDDIVPSIEFHLAPGSSPVTLRVHPAKRGSNSTLGGVFAVLGASSAFAGVLLLILDAAEHEAADAAGSASPDTRNQLQGRADTFGDIGIGLLAAGALIGTGAVFLLQSGKTDLVPVTDAERAHAAAGSRIRLIPGGFSF